MDRKEELRMIFKQNQISFQENVKMSDYTTMKIGGHAWFLVEISNREEISMVLKEIKRIELPFIVVGNGSNLLFDDSEYEGVIILLSKNFNKIEVRDNLIYAQAGANLKKICEVAHQYSLTGLEFAYGIPGTVGGGVYMNAGAFDGELKDVVKEIEYLDENGMIQQLICSPTDFSYRKSFFTNTNNTIIHVILELEKGDSEKIRLQMDNNLMRRQMNQPLEYPSAGSVFKRPTGNYASALIEQCGCKGLRVNGAMVSMKHAGFLINVDHSTFCDMMTCIELVQKEVFSKTNIMLELEVKVITGNKVL